MSITSSGNSALPSPLAEEGDSPVISDEVPPETATVGGGDNLSAPVDAASSSHSGSSGHLNQSFSACDEDLNTNANTCPVSGKVGISRSNSSISGDSNKSGSNNNSDPAADTFQNFKSSPVPTPKDVDASTPMTYIEPKVIVVDNGAAADSDDTMGDLFHSNNNMALDTAPVLAPTNGNDNNSKAPHDNDPEKHSKPTETQPQEDDDDVTYDEGYGTGKFPPEGEIPLLPPSGKSPGLQHNKGKQKLKAKRGSKSKSDNV